MFGFVIKKWFFDYWDNLFAFFAFNVLFVALGGGLFYYVGSAGFAVGFIPTPRTVIPIIVIVVAGLFIFNLFAATVSRYTCLAGSTRRPEIKELFKHLKQAIKPALFLTVLIPLIASTFLLVIPMYGNRGGPFNLLASGFIFWITLFILLCLQYLLPVYWQMHQKLFKSIKKCAMIALDNIGFTLLLGIGTVLVIAVSAITLGMLFGVSAVLMFHQTALRIRLMKYDYLEETNYKDRKHIPWDAILANEKEKIGTKSIKNFFFPWKD